MTQEELRQIQQKQQAFFDTGLTRDLSYRIAALRKLKRAILFYEKELLVALREDLGKSSFESLSTESRFVIQELNQMIRHLPSWGKTRRVRTPWGLFPATSRICPEPYGRVLIISPWNYPFQLSMTPLVGAIAAGNCVTLKTARLAPHTSEIIGRIIGEVFEAGHVSHIPGDAGVNPFLLDERFDYVFFTGSSENGRKVMEAAARFLTPVCLELGGKNPCVVDRDARLDYAARRIAWGKLINAGQTCVAPDYLLVHQQVKDRLVEELRRAFEKFLPEGPVKSPDYASIIDAANFERLKSYLDKPGKVIYGGVSDAGTRTLGPTLIDEPGLSDPVMQTEIFGPVLPVLSFSRIEEAYGIIQRYAQPLAAYYFSKKKSGQASFLCRIPSGTGAINDTVLQIANPHLPYGGRGHSGTGKYHGKKSFETFSHARSLVISPNYYDFPLRYPPYTEWKNRLARFFLR